MEQSVSLSIKANGFYEAVEKANQLKSLLQEVKELCASLSIEILFDEKPIINHRKDA